MTVLELGIAVIHNSIIVRGSKEKRPNGALFAAFSLPSLSVFARSYVQHL